MVHGPTTLASDHLVSTIYYPTPYPSTFVCNGTNLKSDVPVRSDEEGKVTGFVQCAGTEYTSPTPPVMVVHQWCVSGVRLSVPPLLRRTPNTCTHFGTLYRPTPLLSTHTHYPNP